MEYHTELGICEKHGLTTFIEEYPGLVCGECMGEDFEEMVHKEIEIIAELNLNEVGF